LPWLSISASIVGTSELLSNPTNRMVLASMYDR
jgi:hypothetical protein